MQKGHACRQAGIVYPALLIIGTLVIALVILVQTSPLSVQSPVLGISSKP